MSGALLQGLTRNPLADPGLLGITAGATIGMVLAVAVWSVETLSGYLWYSFLGAALAAGLSTALEVSAVSGRGVGMDVVKRNIMSLRGSIQINSEPGRGTLVRIRLPLTLAIIDGFLVGVGRASYVVPLDMVQECVELAESERAAARQHQILNLRGEVLPLIFLRSHFGLDAGQNRREIVVVVRCAGYKAGLVVDELQGEFQTVIKPLGKLFSGLRGVSGSTILGDGSVALILDVQSLIQLIMHKESRNPDWYGGETGVARIQQDYRGTLQ